MITQVNPETEKESDSGEREISSAGVAVSLPRERRRQEPVLSYFVKSATKLWSFKFALVSLVINQLRKRYQRTVLGFAWSLLNPLLTMVVMTTIFSLLFHRDPRTFAIFLITGLLPWSLMRDSIATGASSIVRAESFLKKVDVPKAFFPISTVLTESVNFVLSLISLSILGLCVGMHLHLSVLYFPVIMLLMVMFTIGFTIAVSVATVYFRDLTHILNVILNCLFYFTPIFYALDQVPPEFRKFFFANPFYYFVSPFRAIIHFGQAPDPNELLVATGLAIISLLGGLLILRWRERDLIFRL